MSQYDSYIDKTAAKYGIRPDILHRLVKNESGGNQSAVSPKGAIGITQLMPGTAKELGVDPNDPYQNIEGGAMYLRKGLDKFNGDYSQALAGYNTGLNRKAVINKDWNMLPLETKKYVNGFMDLLITPAHADETPYREPAKLASNPAAPKDTILDLTDARLVGSERPAKLASNPAAPKDTILDLTDARLVGSEKVVEEKPKKEVPILNALVQGAGNFATAGFGDELAGALAKGKEYLTNDNYTPEAGEKAYLEARNKSREYSDAAWEQHPVAYGTGAVVGGVVSPINKIAKGADVVKQGGILGGIYGTGSADEMKDVPMDAAVGAVTGAAGGKLIDSGAKGFDNFVKKTLVNDAQSIITKKVDDIVDRVAGTNMKNRHEAVARAEMNKNVAYKYVDSIAKDSQAIINPEKTAVAIKTLKELDKSLLKPIYNNKLGTTALSKLERGEQLTGQEAVELHRQFTELSPKLNGRALQAVKTAKKSLKSDFKTSASLEINEALTNADVASARYVQSMDLNDVITRQIKQTSKGEVLDLHGLANTGLKNWMMQSTGRKAVQHNPGLGDEVKKLQGVVNGNQKLKALPKIDEIAHPFNAVGFIGSSIFGRSIPGFISRTVASGAGFMGGGPIGAIAADGVVGLSGLGAKKAGEAIAKTPFVRKVFARAPEKKLTSSLAPKNPKWEIPTSKIIPNTPPPSSFPPPEGFTGPTPKWTPPAANDIKYPTDWKNPPVDTGPKLLEAPNPLRTIRPGNVDVVGKSDRLSAVPKDVPMTAKVVEKPVMKPKTFAENEAESNAQLTAMKKKWDAKQIADDDGEDQILAAIKARKAARLAENEAESMARLAKQNKPEVVTLEMGQKNIGGVNKIKEMELARKNQNADDTIAWKKEKALTKERGPMSEDLLWSSIDRAVRNGRISYNFGENLKQLAIKRMNETGVVPTMKELGVDMSSKVYNPSNRAAKKYYDELEKEIAKQE